MLYGLPEVDISKLQQVQSMCTQLVLNRNPYSSTTEALRTLHWIPVRVRITLKLLCIVHKCQYRHAPQYLKDLLVSPSVPERNLRSSADTSKLIIPYTKSKTFAPQSFSIAGPTEWNGLPISIRNIKSCEQFKKSLKTHLFYQYFN